MENLKGNETSENSLEKSEEEPSLKEPEEEPCFEDYSLIRQIRAIFHCILMSAETGFVMGYSAILLPQLEEPSSTIRANIDQQSWIASMAPLAMSVGCLLGGWSLNVLGSRMTSIVGAVIYSIGWIVIYFSTTFELILLGRLITGLCSGYSAAANSCFVGEMTTPKYRGFFLSFLSQSATGGMLVIHIMGIFIEWKTLALIMAITPVFPILFAIGVPDSPEWLAKKAKFRKMQKSLEWRQKTQINVEELHSTTSLNNKNEIEAKHISVFETLKQKQFLKALMVLNLFFMLLQLAGNSAVAFYSIGIVQKTVPGFNKYAAMIVLDVTRFIMSGVTCILTKAIKLRPLTFVSAFGTILSLYLLALFTYLAQKYPTNQVFNSIPLVFLVSFTGFHANLSALPWNLSAEIFPVYAKGLGCGISIAFNYIAFFIVVKTSPQLFANYGASVAYTIYSTLTAFASVLLYFFLPETRNKTLVEIQKSFK